MQRKSRSVGLQSFFIIPNERHYAETLRHYDFGDMVLVYGSPIYLVFKISFGVLFTMVSSSNRVAEKRAEMREAYVTF